MDELHEACIKVAENIGDQDPIWGAYVIEQFTMAICQGETPAMALSLARKVWDDPEDG